MSVADGDTFRVSLVTLRVLFAHNVLRIVRYRCNGYVGGARRILYVRVNCRV